MPKAKFEILTFKREMVQRKYIVEVDEKQLRQILSELSPAENVLNLNEEDFLEYPDGRGQICTRIELMGAGIEMRRLQEIVGKAVYAKGMCGKEVQTSFAKASSVRSGKILVGPVRTVPG